MHYRLGKLLQLLPRLNNAASHIIARRYEQFVSMAKGYMVPLDMYVGWVDYFRPCPTKIRLVKRVKGVKDGGKGWIKPVLEVYGNLSYENKAIQVPNYVVLFWVEVYTSQGHVDGSWLWKDGKEGYSSWVLDELRTIDLRIVDEDLKIERDEWIKKCRKLIRYLKRKPAFHPQNEEW